MPICESQKSRTFRIAAPCEVLRKLAGLRSGGGANGHREQIQCRAGYSLSKNGAAIAQTLACASDSYQLDFNSDAVAVGHSVQGHWRETTRQARGSLKGWIADGQFRGSVAGSTFIAAVSLKSNGSKQILYIRASAGDIAIVDVVLARSDV